MRISLERSVTNLRMEIIDEDEELESVLGKCNSYSRLPALLALMAEEPVLTELLDKVLNGDGIFTGPGDLNYPPEIAVARWEWRNGLVTELRTLHAKISRDNWFRFLGDFWSLCDNIGSYREELREVLTNASRDDLDAMMSSDARAQFRKLPDPIIAFRGCAEGDIGGLFIQCRP